MAFPSLANGAKTYLIAVVVFGRLLDQRTGGQQHLISSMVVTPSATLAVAASRQEG